MDAPNNIDDHHRESILVTRLHQLSNPEAFFSSLDTEVIKSTLAHQDPHTQVENLVHAFNENHHSIMTKSVFGHRIHPDEFRIVVKNNVPELVPPGSDQLRIKLYPLSPSTETQELGTHKQTELFFGGYGTYVVNVPQGKIAKAWKGNIPTLLGHGPHVIHDGNLKPVHEADLVDMNAEYINHGTIHIIWVRPGYCQKIWIGTTPYFLTPSQTPYVFNQPLFSRPDDPTKLTEGYISHGNFNIVQVPKGKVAKVWMKSTMPQLLEASDEPFVFTDPSFKLDRKSPVECFEDATDRIIIHGSIKRIMPRTGEVAITYNNGILETFGPNKNKEPILITEINHTFDRFLTINIQTIEFPSAKTIEKRIRENLTSKTSQYPDVNYEVFRTSDGLPIGVKLLVVFEIDNPNLTLSRLNPENIMSHIESLVVADMGMVIQNCNSTDFLKSNHPAVKEASHEVSPIADFYEHLQQKVFSALKKDFAEYGIHLSRLNIETPKVLDATISAKMAEFSLMNTEAGAKISVMDKNFDIAKRQAEQEANKKAIAQQQENEQRIAQSKAEMESSKLKAEAKLIEVRAEVEAQQMMLEIARKRAELYDNHPGLLQYEMAKVNVDAVHGISTMVISPEVASMVYNMPGFKQVDGNHHDNAHQQHHPPTLN